MNGPFESAAHDAETFAEAAEFTVGALSRALKRTLEDNFEFVRVRGEISNAKRHSSGHLYLCLKDDQAKLEGVMWRGPALGLRFKPEDGLEVVCYGRITTYAPRSQYQLVIEHMEPAGLGALMALLEERRQRLAAEGLFDPARKRPLPFLPEIIGVVTSPTGAVIRDILHRLADRFPRRVLLWPVPVQGEQAADQIAAAIAGFNALGPDGPVPRPDVLIVARGGGSVEDLWAFNEEVVVRAAAASAIPLISAVGHETDTTLIDHAADLRAPTPTAAAEMAVPVRSELVAQVLDFDGRRARALGRLIEERRHCLNAAARALPRPSDLLGLRRQRFDSLAECLPRALNANVHVHNVRLHRSAGPLRAALARSYLRAGERELARLDHRLTAGFGRQVEIRAARLQALGQLIESYSYKGVLARGFAVVRDAEGRPVAEAASVDAGAKVEIEFQDGRLPATVGGPPHAETRKARTPRTKAAGDTRQPVLL